MTRLRQGFLSDENMKKECLLHQPIPMNRIDLLPRPMENRSGIFTRPLKDPKIIARPESAKIMLDATQRLTGSDLTVDYMEAVKEEPKIVPMPTYPRTLPETQGIPVTPYYGNAYSLSVLLYNALANQHGITSEALSAGSDWSSVSSATSVSVDPYEPTLSEELEGASEQERHFLLESERRRIYKTYLFQDDPEGGNPETNPYIPVVSETAPPKVPEQKRPVMTLPELKKTEGESSGKSPVGPIATTR